MGGFIDEGLAIGIIDNAGLVDDAMSGLVDYTAPDLGLNSNIGIGLDDKTRDLLEDKQPINVTVKVGEDTLISKIVDGINDLSNLTNQTVINV